MQITVHTKTNAGEEKIETMGQDRLKVWVKETPENNKANYAIIKILAEYFGVSKSRIKLLGGAKSKQKIFNIKDE